MATAWLPIQCSFAATANYSPTRLTSIIQLACEHSAIQKSSHFEVIAQEATSQLANKVRLIPKIDLSASFAQNYYDRLREDSTGRLISNNGQAPLYSLTVTYDLQKLFGPESLLSKKAVQIAKVKEKIGERGLVRTVKKSYFVITEIKAEITEFEKVITQFTGIEGILTKQKRMGLYNEIERQQFKAQQSILESDLQAKRSELDNAYFQLSTSINVDVGELKMRVDMVSVKPQLQFADRLLLAPEAFANAQDNEVLQNLSLEYDLANMDYENFNSTPLPVLYARGSRTSPTMPSSDGPQILAEVGISIPLEGFVTRSTQKSQLGAKSAKAEAVHEQALLDYRNQVRQNVLNLVRFKNQKESLEQARIDTQKLLDKAFLFYSQKRIDVLGTLDIFQKYLQASRNRLVNDLQIATTDAELEYLIGGSGQ